MTEKKKTLYPYYETLFNDEKEHGADKYNNKGEPWKYYAK